MSKGTSTKILIYSVKLSSSPKYIQKEGSVKSETVESVSETIKI